MVNKRHIKYTLLAEKVIRLTKLQERVNQARSQALGELQRLSTDGFGIVDQLDVDEIRRMIHESNY